MFGKIDFIDDPGLKASICETILCSLPLWFGIPESNREYCDGVMDKPFLRIINGDDTIGFASLKRNSDYALELYVMGIKLDYHHKGIGKRLMKEIVSYAKQQKYRFLEVKTLDESRESEEYKRTRLFYASVGFKPLDVLYNEWGNENPCLIMVMYIAPDGSGALEGIAQ